MITLRKYKPEYLGKAIPVTSPSGLTDFVHNKYDTFTKIYEVCRDDSEKINDIKTLDSDNKNLTSLSMKISADNDVLSNISNKIKEQNNIDLQGDIITATS